MGIVQEKKVVAEDLDDQWSKSKEQSSSHPIYVFLRQNSNAVLDLQKINVVTHTREIKFDLLH